ncbi:MAG: twin-arginine translocase subunit TatB [Ectothiorhodospiraceae bacterium AqS1]|nr:twin-arginine translocase subunit TatB [Ectothiorhodospiraceae bacterium AqS1]
MFDIGFLEIALISIIALLVVGPERLPKMVRTIGLWMGRIRRYINQAKNDIDREVRLQEWKEQLAKPAAEFDHLRQAAGETKEVFKEAKSAIESVDSKASKGTDSSPSKNAEKNAEKASSIGEGLEEQPEDSATKDDTAGDPAGGSRSSSKIKPKAAPLADADAEGSDNSLSDGKASSIPDEAESLAGSAGHARSDDPVASTGDGSKSPALGADTVAPSKESSKACAPRSSMETLG